MLPKLDRVSNRLAADSTDERQPSRQYFGACRKSGLRFRESAIGVLAGGAVNDDAVHLFPTEKLEQPAEGGPVEAAVPIARRQQGGMNFADGMAGPGISFH
jgi:hypothetical protein